MTLRELFNRYGHRAANVRSEADAAALADDIASAARTWGPSEEDLRLLRALPPRVRAAIATTFVLATAASGPPEDQHPQEPEAPPRT